MQKVFLEIGVCDFDTLLPLCDNGWKGYFVEPVYEYASWLLKQVIDNGYDASVHCAAISSSNGLIKMITSNGKGAEWTKGISHVLTDRQGLLWLPANTSFRDKVIEVPCYTLDKFIFANKIDRIDFLKVDVEGHEMEVLKNYSWDVIPSVIKIEHSHVDKDILIDMLDKKGYIVYNEANDLYAVR